MENVLVSGGAGYIGSHAVRALAAAGHRVVILDNLSTGHREFSEGFDFVEADVGDSERVGALVKKYRISAAMHFASFINVGDSVVEPAEYYMNNVASGIRFIATLQKSGVRKFILSSTCAVYGALTEARALSEKDAIQPLNPYAHAKRMLEIVLEDFAKAYDFRVVIFRYFNAAGAVKAGGTGEWHEPETHLIPNILRAAMSDGKTPVRIFGNDYHIQGRDGTAVRDYIHVGDLVDAHVRGLDYLQAQPGLHVFNLGTGNGASVHEVVTAAREVLQLPITTELHPRRAGDAPYLVADNRRAHEILGWSPTNSGLKSIIESAWVWEKKLATVKNRH
ncbi:MAG: UDP-glucose 4-epimerase GalE [Spirochaetes bacterium]|nr:UDP-glucose 4-epimerase GalE [Spirochaetota bacterium]